MDLQQALQGAILGTTKYAEAVANAEAVAEVITKPVHTPRARTIRRAAERQATTTQVLAPITIEAVADGVIEPLIRKPRKVVITKSGGWYRARFQGGAFSTFGYSRQHAERALRFWAKEDAL